MSSASFASLPRTTGRPVLLATAAAMTLLMSLLASAGISHAEDLPFLFKFGGGDEALAFPTGVAFDSSDNVYVVEDFGWRVQKFESDGTFITSWFSGSFPFDVKVDSSDNVYVSERAAHRVVKFSPDGDMLGWLGKCTEGVNCDTEHGRSNGFTCTDTTCQGLGPGSGEGQFSETRGIAIGPTGNIYIGDQRNSRVQVFDPDGNFLFMLGERGTGDGQFINVIGVAVDSLGNVYVTDHTDEHVGVPRIQKFNSAGAFIGWLGKCTGGINCDTENQKSVGFSCTDETCTGLGTGTGDGQLDPASFGHMLAIDMSDNIYVTERGNARVQKFTSSGEFVGWAGKCTDGANCDTENQRSMGFSCTDETCTGLGTGAGDGQFVFPQAVGVNSQMNVYVVDYREDAESIVHVFGATEMFKLAVQSVDLDDNTVHGMWTVVRSTDGSILKTGFTPLTFTGLSGNNYNVSVANYDGKIFQEWADGAMSKTRTVNLSSDITLTAVYDTGDTLRGFTPLAYAGTEEQPGLTVRATVLDGSKALHMWTIIDPQSSDESGTTYKVHIHNYQDFTFDHWDDGSTDMVKTLTISEDTTITAFYRAAHVVSVQSVAFAQKTVLLDPEIDMSLRGVDSSVTCPDGTAFDGTLFGFAATRGEDGTVAGHWSALLAPGAAADDGGPIASASVTSTDFRLQGDWTGEAPIMCDGVPQLPSTVVIEGPCGDDVIVTFAAANGTTGTFRGSAVCKA